MKIYKARKQASKEIMDADTTKEVADAAMNLVLAVTAGDKASGLALQNTANRHLEDIKTGVDNMKTAVTEEGASTKTTVEEKCASLETKLDALQSVTEELLAATERASKMQRIEFGLNHLALVTENFQYGTKGTGAVVIKGNTDKLFQDILLNFRQDFGTFITNHQFCDADGKVVPLAGQEDGKEKFRNELTDRLHKLLGQKPRMATKTDGRILIFYK